MANTATDSKIETTEKKSVWTSNGKTFKRLSTLLDASRVTHVPVYLESEPGMAKTSMILQYAESRGLYCHILLGSTMSPEDINGLPANRPAVDTDGNPALDAEGNRYNVTDYSLNHWADQFFQRKSGVIFIDEIKSATPSVLASLLTFVQNRVVGGRKLPDDVIIVAAGNPSETAADGYDLPAPMANRLLHVQHNLDFDEWSEGMKVKFGKDMTETEEEARRLFVNFLGTYRNEWNAIPKIGENGEGGIDAVKAGGAWPSPRSWDNAAAMWGQITDPSMRITILRGLVGDLTADNFKSWMDSLNIPSYEEIMDHPERLNWKKFRADEVYTIVDMVADRATVENYDKTLKVFGEAAVAGRTDVTTAVFFRFCGKVSDMAATLSTLKEKQEFAMKAVPIVAKFGVDYTKAGLNTDA